MKTRILAAALLMGAIGLTGCGKNGELSQQEMDQMKKGPSREMPAEARAAVQSASQAGPPPQAAPPAGAQ